MSNFTTDASICIERVIEPHIANNIKNNISEDYEISRTCKWIAENEFSKVCLQFPDELLGVSVEVYEEIKKNLDVDLYILGDTSYASCCVDSVAAMHVQAQAVVHYGRSCFSKTDIPLLTILPKKDLDISIFQLVEDVNGTLCLFYDLEYEHCKDTITTIWFNKHPQCYMASVELTEHEDRFLGRVIRDGSRNVVKMEELEHCHCVYLGCNGQTLFNYTVSVPAKSWLLLDPETKQLEKMDQTAWFKRRRFLIEKCKDANVIGILVCKLSGDQTKDIISRMKELCKVNQKKSYIVSVGKPNVAKLANFPEIDIYVMIACPENDLYSSRDFYKPIVYPYELEVALNSNRISHINKHITDFDQILPGRRHHCSIETTNSLDVSLITGKIREKKVAEDGGGNEVATKENWALNEIGQLLSERSWTGLQQNLGETEVKLAEEGRKGIPLQYNNEPE